MESWLEIRPLAEAARTTARKAEGAAWRAIVRERLGPDTEIGYNAAGAPVLTEGRGYIGVSHTRGWVAVVWSPHPCAIDIELKTRTISAAVATRMGIAPEIEAWCAHEATYKYRGLTGNEPEASKISYLPHPKLVVAVIR
ncbi:MAG: hypothetical protein LBV38_00510 [Alistipes sp.]|jgi:phosphopantetheinyl transferase|nr:hypothetical protein [Alistipes sp.]